MENDLNLVIQLDDFLRVCYVNKLNMSLNWKQEKLVKDCSKEELKQINLRSWKKNEVILDIEDTTDELTKIKVDNTRKKLIENKINFTEIESRRKEGRHFHLFFNKLDELEDELRKQVKHLIIIQYNADEKALGKYISMENRPHFKDEKLIKVISCNLTSNELNSNIIYEAQKILEKSNYINLSKESDTNFKEYFEKDEFMIFLRELASKNEVIPDGTNRHMIIFKNLAIACVKSGLPGKQINDIMKPLIEKVMPDKSIKDLTSWIYTINKSVDGKFNVYNYTELNKWTFYYYAKNIYNLSMQIDIINKLEKEHADIYEIYKNIFNYTWTDITQINTKFLIPISQIKDDLIQKFLISALAFKGSIKSKDLIDRINKLKDSNNMQIPSSLFDLITNTIVDDIQYYIEPLIPKKCLIALGARAGQFKTNFVLALCLNLLKSNNKFLNVFNCQNNENIKILYYDIETGKENILRRLITLLKGFGYSNEILKNFEYTETFNKNRIELELERAMKYDIIILDSYRRFLKDSENDSEITELFYKEFLKPLKDAGKTVIILHHFKKLKFETYSEEELMDAFRGSGDIVAQQDLALCLFKSDDMIDNNNHITFNVDILKAKNRLGLPIKNFTFQVLKNDSDKKSTMIFQSFFNRSKGKTDNIVKAYIIELVKEKEMAREELISNVKAKYDYEDITIDKYLKQLISSNILYQPKYGFYKKVELL